MEPLGISSGAAGLISLGITVCQGLLDYYDSWKGAQGSVAHMYASIEALTKTLKLLKSTVHNSLFRRDVAARVEECIKSVEHGFQSLQKKLDKVQLVPLKQGWKAKAEFQFRRTLFPFKESTLAKLKELGIELRDDLSLALHLLQIDSSADALEKMDLVGQTLTDVSTSVSTLKERSNSISENVRGVQVTTLGTSESINGLVLAQTHDQTRKVCKWLSPLTAEFQRKQLDTFNIQNRQDGTAHSFFEISQFKHWLNGTGTTLWCPGIPGSGKTVLASCIIDHVRSIVDQEDLRLAYIYISYKDAENQTVTNLMMSLVSQLASSDPSLLKDLIACYEAHGSGASRPSHAESTQLLRSIAIRCTKVFVIIDAFDECSEECRNLLLTELEHLQPKMNLLITSRHLPNVESQLRNATRLEFQAKSDDISQYVQERVAQSERIQSHAKKDLSLCNLISTTIAAKAEGMFLQARLHLDSLATTTTLRKLKEALMSLPEGLDKTYDETLERVHTQHLDQANLARKALYWVFFASRPLTMLELQHALAVETGDPTLDEENIPDEGLLLSICNGLLIHQKEGGYLSLVHYTLQQYLELKAAVLFPEAKVEMVRTTLTYLMFDEFGEGPCHGNEDLEARLNRWPLLRYAVFKWGQHARGLAEEHCKDLIMSFLSRNANVSASIQVLCVRKLRGLGYWDFFPKNVHALWLASFHGLEDTVLRLLADDKGSVLPKTTWGDTALHRAAGCGHARVVQLLLDHGADPCAKDSAGNTPLHLATLFRDDISAHDIFTSNLLENRGRMVQQVRTLRYSLAVKKLLLIHGADVDAVNLRSESPLHLAVCDGHKSLTRLLLDNGADITLKDRNGLAPLSIATECGHIGVTRALLEYDLQKQINLGILNNALRRAAHKDNLPLLQVLMSKSPKVLPTDSEGRNLLHMSSYDGNLKCLTYLAELGFDFRVLGKQGRSCLHHAAGGTGEALEFLLRYGLDPKQPDIDGWTPLVWAAGGSPKPSVLRLLQAGGFPENGKEWVPYAVAMFHDGADVAALLVPPGQVLPKTLGDQNFRTSLLHQHIVCDGCDRLVFGSRYHCTACVDFDYCFKCFRSAKITHRAHEFKSVYWEDEEAQDSDALEVMKQIESKEAVLLARVTPA